MRFKIKYWEVAVVAQWAKNQTAVPEEVGLIPGLARWVKDWHCLEVQCRSQMRLRSGVAVAMV